MQTFYDYRTKAEAFGTIIDNMDDWLVLDIMRHRDSDCLTESNWRVAIKKLGGETYDSEEDTGDVSIVRFGHWAVGWVEHILVRPNSPAHNIAIKLEEKLNDYPILDDDDFSNLEDEEAHRVWKDCYSPKERIEYIRENRSQFDFPSFAYMLSCVRGECFSGYASELIQ
jgi:hypothetical protein